MIFINKNFYKCVSLMEKLSVSATFIWVRVLYTLLLFIIIINFIILLKVEETFFLEHL